MFKKLIQKSGFKMDFLLLFIVAILVILGSIMVFSSSVIMAEARWQTPYLFIIKHIIWIIFGTIAMLFFSQFDYHNFQKAAKPLIIIGTICLVLVLFIGTVKGGARRWIQFGPISFQPSELCKLILIIGLADYLDRKKSRLKYWKGLMPALFLIGFFSILVALEPDLGTPVLMVCIGLSMLFAAGTEVKKILIMVSSILPFIIIETIRKPYRLQRIKDFLRSWVDLSAGSYQLTQSILALGSGGFLGKGLARGQMKLLYLPEPHTDFIFPIIGEELGFIGAVLTVSLFLLFAWRGWVISRNSKDYFGCMLAVGITWAITFQAFFNIGVATGLLPTKGLPLPFVSFGGTALFFNLIGVGILLNISKDKINKQVKNE